MTWANFAKLTRGDMCFTAGAVLGGLIALGVVVLIVFAAGLALARFIIGG